MTNKNLIEDMTEQEKEKFEKLSALLIPKDHPLMIDWWSDFWSAYHYVRKSPVNKTEEVA